MLTSGREMAFHAIMTSDSAARALGSPGDVRCGLEVGSELFLSPTDLKANARDGEATLRAFMGEIDPVPKKEGDPLQGRLAWPQPLFSRGNGLLVMMVMVPPVMPMLHQLHNDLPLSGRSGQHGCGKRAEDQQNKKLSHPDLPK